MYLQTNPKCHDVKLKCNLIVTSQQTITALHIYMQACSQTLIFDDINIQIK